MSEWKQSAIERREQRRARPAESPSTGKKRGKRHVEKPFVVEHKIIGHWWFKREFSRVEDADHYADKCRRDGWDVRTNYEA